MGRSGGGVGSGDDEGSGGPGNGIIVARRVRSDMGDNRATVTCPTCGFEESFDRLRAARARIEEHREETGHDPVWELSRLAPGVERAGDEAGVCGRLDL